jgi:Xaa-Pro aminopeptidase
MLGRLLFLLVMVVPASLPAQQRYWDWTTLSFTAAEFAGRRARLAAALAESGGGVFLAPAADGLSHGDTFRQLDDFMYLTGLELPNSVMVLEAASGRAIIFAPANDPRFENPGRPNDFPGRSLAADPAIPARAGIGIRPWDEFTGYVDSLVASGTVLRLRGRDTGPIAAPVPDPILRWSEEEALLDWLMRRSGTPPHVSNAFEAVARLRMTKSPAEIALMRRAADATMDGILESARLVRAGVDERTLIGAFEAACRRHGSARLPFSPIIKSGPNSLWPWRILGAHAGRRNRAMQDGELVIFDVGCEADGYVSDVGRTLPVSGHFTPEQRALVAMVSAISDAAIAAVRPGASLHDVQRAAQAAMPAEAGRYMQAPTYFGHHIGLDAGDPALEDVPLAPGMVLTIEPWYYNHDRGVAVFVEDVLLVTPGGVEVLTRRLPRTPEALERLTPR